MGGIPEKLTVEDLRPVAYILPSDANPGFEDKVISHRNTEGEIKWSVHRESDVLCRDGTWEYEAIPSYRTQDFLDRARFDSLEEALDAYSRFVLYPECKAFDTMDEAINASAHRQFFSQSKPHQP